MLLSVANIVMVRAPTAVLQVPSEVRLEGHCARDALHKCSRDTLCTHASAINISTNKALSKLAYLLELVSNFCRNV